MRLETTSQLLQFGRGHPSHFYQLWPSTRRPCSAVQPAAAPPKLAPARCQLHSAEADVNSCSCRCGVSPASRRCLSGVTVCRSAAGTGTGTDWQRRRRDRRSGAVPSPPGWGAVLGERSRRRALFMERLRDLDASRDRQILTGNGQGKHNGVKTRGGFRSM